MSVVVSAEVLKSVLKIFNKAGIDLVKVYAEGEYLNVLGMDSAMIVMVGASIEVEEEGDLKEVVVGAKDLYKVVKNMSGGVKVGVHDVVLSLSDGEFEIELPTYVDEEVDIDFKSFEEVLAGVDIQFNVSEEKLKRILNVLSEFKFDEVIIMVGDGEVKFLADNGEVSYRAVIGEAFPEGEGDAKYSAELLKPLKGVKGEILMRFGEDKPLVVNVVGDEYEVFYVVAPRIKG